MTSDLAVIEQAIGALGIDLFGAGLWAGIVIIFLFCAWLTVGGYSFETTILALWALGYILTEAALLPGWFWIVEIIVAAIIVFFAAMKVLSRAGVL